MSLIRGDALTIPLADDSVDLIVTSPPYFALRSYTDDGEHYAGQLGSEATPAAFIDALVSVTRECVRVLKPSGSLFVNLGDKYSGVNPGSYRRDTQPFGPNGATATGTHAETAVSERAAGHEPDWGGVRSKSLMGLPWRYALACIDQLGLILRAEIIWSKPNGLPESVQDRVRRSHETWFHFTLEPRYYSAVDEIREAYSPETASFQAMKARFTDARTDEVLADATGQKLGRDVDPHGGLYRDGGQTMNPLGKLPGSVWTVPTEPLRVPDDLPQHFAAFPSEWPRRVILGWSPSGICTECGEGRRPVTELDEGYAEYRETTGDWNSDLRAQAGGYDGSGNRRTNGRPQSWQGAITGESCACPTPTAPTRKAVVLDPFAGTGTVPAVANALGRYGIGIDLSADYLKLARWRCQDPGLRAKVLGVDKPAPEVPGQMAFL